jgi:hypothetical protein
MFIFLSLVTLIIWLTVGLLTSRNMDDAFGGAFELETLALPLRITSIILAPITFLIFERHIFYRKAEAGKY